MPPVARRHEPHWVYRLFDAYGVLLYVGMTRDPVNRFSTWRNNTPAWWGDVSRIDWRKYPDYEQAKQAETFAIRSEGPRHNKLHNHLRLEAVGA